MRGVRVTLRHAGPDAMFGTADDRSSSTLSAADGSYGFINLAPGNVRIVVAKPTGYSYAPCSEAASDPSGGGTTATRDSNVDRTTGSADVTLVSGRNRSDVDAGLIAHGGLGGVVWNDGTGSGDGQRGTGEPGVPGITVRLLLPDGTPALNDAGQPIATVTGADGTYLFADMVARKYIVAVDIPSAYIVTKRAVGDPNSDSDIDVKTYRTLVITVAPLADVCHIGAGILNPVEPFIVPPSTSAPTTTALAGVTTTKRPSVTISDRPAVLDGRADTPAPTTTSMATTSAAPAPPSTTTTPKRRGATIRNQDAQRPDPANHHLALTGTDALRLLGVAGALTLVGTGVTLASRRRRKSSR